MIGYHPNTVRNWIKKGLIHADTKPCAKYTRVIDVWHSTNKRYLPHLRSGPVPGQGPKKLLGEARALLNLRDKCNTAARQTRKQKP